MIELIQALIYAMKNLSQLQLLFFSFALVAYTFLLMILGQQDEKKLSVTMKSVLGYVAISGLFFFIYLMIMPTIMIILFGIASIILIVAFFLLLRKELMPLDLGIIFSTMLQFFPAALVSLIGFSIINLTIEKGKKRPALYLYSQVHFWVTLAFIVAIGIWNLHLVFS